MPPIDYYIKQGVKLGTPITGYVNDAKVLNLLTKGQTSFQNGEVLNIIRLAEGLYRITGESGSSMAVPGDLDAFAGLHNVSGGTQSNKERE